MKQFEPQKWSELVGNPTAIKNVKSALSKHQHLFVYGKPGLGKHITLKLWSKKRGYRIVEADIKDIKRFILPSFYKKVVVIEEADSFDWFHEGSKIFNIILKSKYSVVFFANRDFEFRKSYDYYNIAKYKRDKIKLEIKFIQFKAIHVATVKKRIEQINKTVGKKIDYSLITNDVRQSILNVFFSIEKNEFQPDIFGRLRNIFSQGRYNTFTKEDIFWIAENIPRVFYGEQIYEAFNILILAIKLNRPKILSCLPRIDYRGQFEYPFFFRRLKAVRSEMNKTP